MLKLPDQVPNPGFYYHYKHDPKGSVENYAYEVLGVGFHTEDDCRPEDACMVTYRPLYESAAVYQASKQLGVVCIDLRPVAMFMGEVTKDNRTFARFVRISDPEVKAQLEKIRDRMYPALD